MVPTQGGVSFPVKCGIFFYILFVATSRYKSKHNCLLLLPGINQNTMLGQPPHLSDICQITPQLL